MADQTSLPEDDYSITLRRLRDNPGAVQAGRGVTINLQTMLGHAEDWIVNTIRVDGRETVLLRRIDAKGGESFILPPEVTAAIARQRDIIIATIRRKSARKAAATREAKGIVPAFVANPNLRGKGRRRKRARKRRTP